MDKEYKLYCKKIKDRVDKKGWCYIKIYKDNILNVYISHENPLQFLSNRGSFLDNTQILICDYYSVCFSVLLV